MERADLLALIPRLKPLADEWAERQSASILDTGQPLDEKWIAIAKFVGVRDPSKVRVSVVPAIPKPDLLAACEAVDYLGPRTLGLTLFYGIFIVESAASDVLLRAHELRHVSQYEYLGSIPKFLDVYLPQLAKHPEGEAPLEVDANKAAAAVAAALMKAKRRSE